MKQLLHPLYFLILITAFFTDLETDAQDAQFTGTATPNVLHTGEQFNLVYTTNEELAELNLPDIRDFEFLGGPSQGHSQSVVSVNGKITTTSTYQYTYFFRAPREGKFVIPPASGKLKNKTIKSNPVTIEVVAAREPAKQESGQANADPANLGDNDLFVRLVVDKSEAFLGDQIVATVKIYTKVRLAAIDKNFKGPEFTGFFTENLEVPDLRNLQKEAVDGVIYYTGVLRKMIIFPQKTGTLTIEPFNLDVTVRQEVRRRVNDPFFDDFFLPDVQVYNLTLTSKPLRIRVNPLPAGQPADFTGAVGSFRLSGSISKPSVTAHEPITLRYTLSGNGNIKLVNELPLEIPYDFEKYDPVINSRMDNPVNGTKTFEYMLVPKVAGSFTIPPVSFSFFDPASKQYRTAKSPGFSITVEKASGDTTWTLAPGLSKEDVEVLGEDIGFIKTRAVKLRLVAYWGRSYMYYAAYLLLALLFIGFLILRNKWTSMQSDAAGMKLRQADKAARKRLRNCEPLIEQEDNSKFYESLLSALWGYISDKLNITVSDLSQDSAQSALESRQVDSETIRLFFSITSTCEMARYGHASGIANKRSLYTDALKVLSNMQIQLRKTN